MLERLRAGKIFSQPEGSQDPAKRVAEASAKDPAGEYPEGEHILVCLSPSPSNAKIIRTAAGMAGAFKGSFTALFVETPDFSAMSEADKNRLRANITLARELGAAIETVYGSDAPFQIGEFARLSGVSKIVVGRSHSDKRGLFRKLSFAERLTNAAPNLDIHIIPDKEVAGYKPAKSGEKFRLDWLEVLKSALVLALATLIGYAFHSLGFSEANIITVYILGVLATAVITGHRIYSIVLSIVSVLTFNFFFTVPRFTLEAYGSGYPVTFFIMFLAAFLTGTLATRIKQHAQLSAQTAYRTKILLETNQLLQKARDKGSVIDVTAGQLTKLLKKDIVFYSSEDQMLMEPMVFPVWEQKDLEALLTKNEQAVAAWVFRNNKHAGATTNTLGSSKCLYLAVRVNETVYGVVGIGMEGEPIDAFENSIVLSILGECALALENQQVSKEREAAAVLAKNEQLRANLLRSISHDLRTPLTTILGNAGILLSSEEAISLDKRRVLYTDIYDDSLWLINLVENLLSVTRIEDGTMRLKLTAELLEEVVSEALSHMGRKSHEHTIKILQSEDFIVAKMDARLITQVIINLVDNAIKYTPKGSEILVSTAKEAGFAAISVADNGPGIPEAAKGRIFDMFYTMGDKLADSRRSLGLGLALCKSIVAAHGGSIFVKDNLPAGTVFTFTLPLEEVVLHE